MNFNKYDSIFYSYKEDKETIDKFDLIFHWDYISQYNFNTSNFYYNNFKKFNFYETSIFIYNFINFYNFFSQKSFKFFNFDNLSLSYHDHLYFKKDNFNNYSHIRKYSFISFFIDNFIDIPICFKKSKSLKSKNFEILFLKFSNLTMKQGKKEKTFRFILNSFFLFYEDIQTEKINSNLSFLNWLDFLMIFNNKIKIYEKNKFLEWIPESDNPVELDENNILYNNSKEFDIFNFIKNFISLKLTQLSPLFLYYIYNVDKNIRKYTRGKSGKYVFIWKYIAPYKRKNLILRWFLKDVKFDENITIKDRFKNLFFKLCFNLNNTLAWKAKNFTYAFIFKNFRKTLMLSLRTTVK